MCQYYPEYKVGDQIVLLERDDTYVPEYFIVGNIYKIRQVDSTDIRLPYEIDLDHDRITGWVKTVEIRLAEPYEIDSLKYNL